MNESDVAHGISNAVTVVRDYHDRTKHAFGRYARGPETIDWSAQPDSFRTYQGAECLKLPLPDANEEMDNPIAYNDLYRPNNIPVTAFTHDSISHFLRYALGLSAWKEYQGSKWSLRCNPSSGNLHPTEAYLISINAAQIPDGVHHYNSYQHALQHRGQFTTESTKESIKECVDKLTTDTSKAEQPLLLMALNSIAWREAWKYGERAFRYCQLDIGHTLAAIRFSAVMLGWEVGVLEQWSNHDIALLTGIDRTQDFNATESESPDLLLCIKPRGKPTSPLVETPDTLLKLANTCNWFGKANVLDPKHLYSWPIIDEVTKACDKPRLSSGSTSTISLDTPITCDTSHSAQLVIQRRRSAQAYDGQTKIDKRQFFRILDVVLPRNNTPPWDCFPWPPATHLLLFVHRIDGLNPGLYLLARNSNAVSALQKNLPSDKFDWQHVEDCPEHIPLFHLLDANCQKASAALSCQQRIASDGVFSVSMLAEFDATLDNAAWRYRQLFWEAGCIGQVLYLEAEAIDLQGTGIGCYFDDAVHEMLVIKDHRLQVMYHFTLGGAYNDPRLRTLAAYHHLQHAPIP